MRHRKATKSLGRKSQPRKALLRSLLNALIIKEKITTTVAKAKFVRPYAEKLVTKAKSSSGQATQRYLRTYVSDKSVKKLVKDLGPKYKDRNGGYTRITKYTTRQGDAAEQAIIEFV